MVLPMLLLTAGFGFILYHLYFRDIRARRFVKAIGGPPALPILENSLTFRNTEDFLLMATTWPEKYGNRVGFILGPYKFFAVLDPIDVEKVLTSTSMIWKSFIYKFMGVPAGYGLPFGSGPKWQKHRKLIMPAFHFKIMEKCHPIFYEQSQILVDIISEHVDRGELLEMHSFITRCALDIVCETAMGTKLNFQRDVSLPHAHAFMNESAYICKRILSPWLYPDFIFYNSKLGQVEERNRKLLIDFMKNMVDVRRVQMIQERARKASGDQAMSEETTYVKKQYAFLDLMLNLQLDGESALTDKDVLDEVVSFMYAGHDTTAASLTWTFMLLGTHPEEQAKVHAELDEIFVDDPHRPIVSSDLPSLKYMECCIKESLRLYPSAPVLARRVVQDFQLDEKTVIPRGMELLILPWVTHRNPKYFPEPEVFRPSRHSPENALGRQPCAFFPFAIGPRSCLGQRFAVAEEKIILANILRHFTVTCVNADNVKAKFEIFARPNVDLMFRFEHRR